MISDPICTPPKFNISDTCRRAASFTIYPEADAVVKGQLVNYLLPLSQKNF